MRKLLIASVATAILTSSSFAQVVYDNSVTFQGQAYAAGGAVDPGNGDTNTRMVMDDITPDTSLFTAGQTIHFVTFSVANLNENTVTIRPKIRFFTDDGPGGNPRGL